MCLFALELNCWEMAHQQRYEEVLADVGYESLDNYLYLEVNGQMSFIKPTKVRP